MRTIRSRAFDEHHVEVAGGEPLLTSGLVFGRVVECLGYFGRRKFDHDETVAVEPSLQNRSRASAHDELSAVLSDGRTGELAVFVELVRFGHCNGRHNVGWHGVAPVREKPLN